MKRYFFCSCLLALLGTSASAQLLQGQIPNMRPYDQHGINQFETRKDTLAYTGPTLRIGAGFTQEFQNLKDQNSSGENGKFPLYKISPGFNQAEANLYTDFLLADGIHLNVSLYLSTRHHNETWVRGGYLQFDKLPFKGQIWSDIMKYTTIKLGQMEINYGDQHFRRTDGGHAMYNPFIENYIVDAFATEIGGEVMVQKNGLFGMVGLTNGMLKASIDSVAVTTQNGNIRKNPAVYGKIGYDPTLPGRVRLRVSASYYHDGSSSSNDLYFGDRAGSSYWMVMEQPYTVPPSGTSAYEADAFSGRLNPGFSYKVDAMMLNGFAKVAGFEFFGTYEHGQGRTGTEVSNRQFNQYAVDGIYRFGPKENLFVGVRYNGVTAELKGLPSPVTINRFAAAGGWFLTKNILLKGEYVTQNYLDFPASDYRSGGKFNGYVIAATVGF
ncbi:hypothetical protein [Dinghuibacter silviterrae]|uniref:Phosphate-selective porin O/P n=1 Tax=Dinghuibacter silviterrae TaxID=1539049 RepID=A0A4R8DGC8_9BACT|nr:hypothetical protein [Dinghuibacter silviterrae]TDW96711.1 hypothetical protein EDB95_4547 [Dinghuibacter silviterrae]